MRTIHSILAAAVLLLTPAAFAVTYIVPPDRELIQLSDDVVVATGVSSLAERTAAGGIVTRFTLRIEEVLKGKRAAGDHLVVTERGGVVADGVQIVPGTPVYQPGERYLVFTDTNAAGDPTTFGMALGQFFFVSRPGRRLALRAEVDGFNQNLDGHVETARDADGFIAYIRGIVAQNIDPAPRYFLPGANARWRPSTEDRGIAAEASRATYMLTDGLPFRWRNPSASFVKSGAAVGASGPAAVTLAFSQWNGTSSDIDYRDLGQDDNALGGLDATDGKNTILFNDPLGVVGNGIAGIGGITSGGAPYDIGGERFWDMFEVDVVMNNGSFAQNCYNTVMTHEVGHTLGFRHSNQNDTSNGPCQAPGVCTSDAIMNSTVQCGWKGILKEYDRVAAATVYGEGVVCNAPAITGEPGNISVRYGTRASLDVTATGTGPLQYRWYEGKRGDDSDPVGSSRSFLSANPITKTTTYWVRVSNACGSSDSRTVTVTALPVRRRAVGHP
jgi:Ig-like domain CHU_C associated/Dual-action HEIGH metallo-peptidase